MWNMQQSDVSPEKDVLMKKRKKKIKKLGFNTKSTKLFGQTNFSGILKTKKKKKEKFSIRASPFEIKSDSCTISKEPETRGSNISSIKKQKKKRSINVENERQEEEEMTINGDHEAKTVNLEIKLSKQQKKRKKRKQVFSEENSEEGEEANNSILEAESDELESELPKQQKKRKKTNKLQGQNDETDKFEIMLSKRQKKIKKTKQVSSEDNSDEDNNSDLEAETDELESEVPKQQKKLKKMKNKLQGQKSETKLMKKGMKMRMEVPGLVAEPELTKFISKLQGDSMGDALSFLDYDSNVSVGGSSSEDDSEVDEKSTLLPSYQKLDNKQQVVMDSPEKNKRTLFVGNLPMEMDVKALTNVFKPFGKVESVRFRSVIPAKTSISQKIANIKHEYHKDSTSLKGFVVFQKAQDAEEALRLNGTILKGHHIRVDKAFS